METPRDTRRRCGHGGTAKSRSGTRARWGPTELAPLVISARWPACAVACLWLLCSARDSPPSSSEGALASRIAGHAGSSGNSLTKQTIRLALIIPVDRSRCFGGNRSAWGNRPPLRPLRRHHMPLTADFLKIDSAGLARKRSAVVLLCFPSGRSPLLGVPPDGPRHHLSMRGSFWLRVAVVDEQLALQK